jgi:hypothetical protein
VALYSCVCWIEIQFTNVLINDSISMSGSCVYQIFVKVYPVRLSKYTVEYRPVTKR